MLVYPVKDLEEIVSESVGRPEADEPPCDIIQTLNKSTRSRARPFPECVPCKVVRFFILVPNLEAFYTNKTQNARHRDWSKYKEFKSTKSVLQTKSRF
jgi:hypothetical protein